MGAKKNKKQRKNKQSASSAITTATPGDKGKQRAVDDSYDYDYDYEYDDTIEYDENGYIPNGFTIDFDEFEGAGARDEEAPRGGPGSQVLPVALHLPKDYAGDPTDGHEYLYLVRREAAGHPGVIVAEAFVKQQQHHAAMLLVSHTAASAVDQLTAGPSHRPSVEWRSAFLSRFTNMRATFANADRPTTSSARHYALPQAYLPIPAAADESSWRTYINGRKKTAGRIASGSQAATGVSAEPLTAESNTVAKQDNNAAMDISQDSISIEADASSGVVAKPAEPTLSMRDPKPPIPLLMQSLENNTTISLLDHFNTWFSERIDNHEAPPVASTIFLPPAMRKSKKAVLATKISQSAASSAAALPTPPATPVIDDSKLPQALVTSLDAQWIFSLLSVLDDLLSSSEISILRSLARTCTEIADLTNTWVGKYEGKASKERMEIWKECIASCWMVVSVIWEVWKQRDLWDG